jgi:hypothetical protein
MIEDRLERPAFALVRAADRTQVDAPVAEQASREIEQREATVSEFRGPCRGHAEGKPWEREVGPVAVGVAGE